MPRSTLRLVCRRDWLSTCAAGLSAAALGGCGQSGEAARHRLRVFNWSAYIHDEVIPKFEKQMGALVVYDNYSSDAELEARLATGGGGYDVVFPSDRSMPALLAKGRLAEIDKGKLPNWRHLDPKFVSPPFDKGNRYTRRISGGRSRWACGPTRFKKKCAGSSRCSIRGIGTGSRCSTIRRM